MASFFSFSSSSRSRGQVATSTTDVITFSLSELTAYTENFSTLIGRGGFGMVYRGTIKGRPERNINGVKIVVKESRNKDQRKRNQFDAELRYLPDLSHKNIINLIGYCETSDKFYLVYPYMKNHDVKRKLSELDWKNTIKIIKGTASAIQELHTHSPPLIYRDLKPDNILLDKDFTPKLTDFGTVTEEGEQLQFGTDGYTDPTIMSTGQGSKQSDIYSLGVVILQLITKAEKVAVGNLHISNSTRTEMHSSIRKGCSRKAAESIRKLALECVKLNAWERPTIAQVIRGLDNL